MGNVRRGWRYILCGTLIGAGAILPGVSGGVLAVVFGIYRPFMELLTHPKSAVQKYWRLALPLGVGWAVGFLLVARGLSAVMASSETVCLWLFIGLIAGSVPGLFREAGKEGRVWFWLCGLAMCAGFWCVRHVLHVQATPNFWWYNFCGVLWGLGTVLPGFSASPIMMALGLYRPLLEDLSHMDVVALSACMPGAVASAALFARLMSRLFRTRHAAVSHGILGIVCASTLFMVPLRYDGAGEILLSGICCGGGFLLASRMGRVEESID